MGDKIPATRRERDLKRIYGMTQEQYDERYAAQRGRCAICGKKTDKLVVDHDHATKKVRSLLCHNCNLAIGHLQDSADIADAVAYYLRRHEKERPETLLTGIDRLV